MSWIFFVARRGMARKRRRSSSSSFLAIAGIAVGVLALTVIIAVMNGFQLGFIESILELSSYHIQIDNVPASLQDDILSIAHGTKDVRAAFPFYDVKGIARGRRGGLVIIDARGLESDIEDIDSGIKKQLVIEDGVFDISASDALVVGAELARRLGVRAGDSITVYSLANIIPAMTQALPSSDGGNFSQFTVTGIFRCGYYEYDAGMAFMNRERAALLDRDDAGDDTTPHYVSIGVKINNRFADRSIGEMLQERIEKELGRNTIQVSTWRDYNKAFFGALRTEKVFMFVLLFLIFIVVAVNVYQGQKRIILEKRDEIGLLRAVGAAKGDVRLIFILNGLVIGASGAILGMVPALLISFHTSAFFRALETVVNAALFLVNTAVSLATGSFAVNADFAVFSPAVFYVKEISARLIPHEVVLIFCAGLFSAAIAAALAAAKVSAINLAEVLRYE